MIHKSIRITYNCCYKLARNMDFTNVCRTCLTTKNLNPIFRDEDDHSRYSTDVFIATGIEVDLDDGLPQNMCTQCVKHLDNTLQFRKLCKETEHKLLRIINDKIKPEIKEGKSTSITDVLKTDIAENKPTVDIKMEYTNYEVFEEDDDTPLKYLIETDNSDELTSVDIDETKAEKQDFEVMPYNIVDARRKRVTCKLCQKNLSIRSIDKHMAKNHPGADERRVKCDLCDNYIMKGKLNRHMVLMHGTGCFRCGYCKTEFDSKDLLVHHVSTCTAKKKKRKINESGRVLHECDICHKTMQKASLRMHKAIKHAGLGPVCEHCGKRFGNKFRLNEHYRAKHGYEKFKCSYCDFQSAGVMAMKNHERRHRGEKPFVCETCGAKFHAAYLLAQHKQSHRTEKLIKCDLCPASFKANNSLHMHKTTCHSSSLYKCTMCSRAYSCRHYAVKHLRHVHDFRGPVPKLQRIPASVEAQ